jgi:group I intron endonuclease
MKYKKEQVIYCITNKQNGKKYIGSTTDFIRRKRTHTGLLNNNKHHSIKLQNSWNKYGGDSFEFKILEYVEDINILIETEQKWLDYEKPELNMVLIAGLNSHIGMKRSDETKKKISESLTGRKLSDEHVEANRLGHIGLIQSDETRKKRGESLKNYWGDIEFNVKINRIEKVKNSRLNNGGYIITDNMKKQISDTLKSKNLQSAISIEIEQYDLEGNLISTYPSIAKAENENGFYYKELHYHLVKMKKSEYKNYKWIIKK